MKKILVLGSSGMLGHVAMLRLEELGYEVFGVSRSRKFGGASALLDLSAKNGFEDFLEKHTFDVVVNCAAILVAQSEKQKDLAVYLNSYLPHFLEEKFRGTETKIIHAGTDGVFSGKSPPYSEDSAHDAEHVYGRTKSVGEIDNDKDLTVRSAFWGPDLNGASASLLNWALTQRGDATGFVNHIFNGVSSLEFAGFLDTAIRRSVTGVYHLAAKNPVSKYEFLLSVKEAFGLKNRIVPTSAESVDRTLTDNRCDAGYTAVDYSVMLADCKKWVQRRRELYPHYQMP